MERGRELRTNEFDEARYIHDYDDVVAYLNVVLEENDLDALVDAIGTVARSEGMTKISERTGLNRESLYRSLREGGNPSFATVQKVLAACGLRLSIVGDSERAALA